MRRSSPSISDVARAAGVSMGTVSNVLNGTVRVTPATRARVEAAIRELGFVRNGVARSLAAGRSSTLGFVIIDLANSYFLDIARGAEEEAGRAGLNLLLANSDMSKEKQSTYVDLLAVGVLQSLLLSSSLRAPDDVAIIGYDDNRAAWDSAVPLSTVRQPGEAVGREAVRLLLEELETGPEAHRHRLVTCEPRLVVRASTAGPS
ncbi:LacI family DNA-binding transcriptional regulator [Isoptericola sp. NPDC060257]|uniref:LacI family DNA-binding transcriptional regulator n=1 Tax=Isoptericola sp. NPDC060257 TaxID=3347087 RepID=UPI00365142D2